MTSKWINEVLSCVSYDTDEQYTKVTNILDRIDAMLRLAKNHTDSEILYEMIEKETFNSEDTIKFNVEELKRSSGTSRIATGISPVEEMWVEDNYGKFEGDAEDGKQSQ